MTPRRFGLLTLAALLLDTVGGVAQDHATAHHAAIPGGAARHCTSSAVVARSTQRFAALDARALDTAVAAAMRRAALTAVPVAPNERMYPDPASAARDAVVVRPVDPAQPDGATIATRSAPDGTTHVVLSGPPVERGGCGAERPRPDDFRFGRGADGRLVPVHVVFGDVEIPFRVCGCAGGCGIAQPPAYDVREFELPVTREALVAAPITLRVARHRVTIVETEVCPVP